MNNERHIYLEFTMSQKPMVIVIALVCSQSVNYLFIYESIAI